MSSVLKNVALPVALVGALRIDDDEDPMRMAPDQALVQTGEVDEPEMSKGDGKCPCVSPDLSPLAVAGGYKLTINDQPVVYPEGMGAGCNAWDDGRYPDKCTGDGQPWCAQKWCYVDPCNCDLDVAPKPSATLQDMKYNGKPLYFSYATCGSPDYFSSTNTTGDARAEITALCSGGSASSASSAGSAEAASPSVSSSTSSPLMAANSNSAAAADSVTVAAADSMPTDMPIGTTIPIATTTESMPTDMPIGTTIPIATTTESMPTAMPIGTAFPTATTRSRFQRYTTAAPQEDAPCDEDDLDDAVASTTATTTTVAPEEFGNDDEIDEEALAAAHAAHEAKKNAAHADGAMKIAKLKIAHAQETRAAKKTVAKDVKETYKMERQMKNKKDQNDFELEMRAKEADEASQNTLRNARQAEAKAMKEAAMEASLKNSEKRMGDLAMKKVKDLNLVKMMADTQGADVQNKAEALKRQYEMDKDNGINTMSSTLSSIQAAAEARRATVKANKEDAMAANEGASAFKERLAVDVLNKQRQAKDQELEIARLTKAPLVEAKKKIVQNEENIARDDEVTASQIDAAESNAREQRLVAETRSAEQKAAIHEGASDQIQVQRDLMQDSIMKAKDLRARVNNAINEDAVKTARQVADEKARQLGETHNAARQASRYEDKQEAEEMKMQRYNDNAEETKMQGNMDVSDTIEKTNKATQEAKQAQFRMLDANERSMQATAKGDNAAAAAEDRAGEKINYLKQQLVEANEGEKQQEADKAEAANTAEEEAFQAKRNAEEDIAAGQKALGQKQLDLEERAANAENAARDRTEKAARDADVKVEGIETQAANEIRQVQDGSRRETKEYENTIARQTDYKNEAERNIAKLKKTSVIEIEAAKREASRRLNKYTSEAAEDLREAQAAKAAAANTVDQVLRETNGKTEDAAVKAAQDQRRIAAVRDAYEAAARGATQKDKERAMAEKEKQVAINDMEHDKDVEQATARKAIKESEAEGVRIEKLNQERAEAKQKADAEIAQDKEKAEEEERNEQSQDMEVLQGVERDDRKAEMDRQTAAKKMLRNKQELQRKLDKLDEQQSREKDRLERERSDQHAANVLMENNDKNSARNVLNMARDEGAKDLLEVKEQDGEEVKDMEDRVEQETKKADEAQRELEEIRDTGDQFVKDAKETGDREIVETKHHLKQVADQYTKKQAEELSELAESYENTQDSNKYKLKQLKDNNFQTLRRAKDNLHSSMRKADRADSEVEKLRLEMNNDVMKAREQGAAEIRDTAKEQEDEMKAKRQEKIASEEEDADVDRAWRNAKAKAVMDARNREADYVDAQAAAQANEDAENYFKRDTTDDDFPTDDSDATEASAEDADSDN